MLRYLIMSISLFILTACSNDIVTTEQGVVPTVDGDMSIKRFENKEVICYVGILNEQPTLSCIKK